MAVEQLLDPRRGSRPGRRSSGTPGARLDHARGEQRAGASRSSRRRRSRCWRCRDRFRGRSSGNHSARAAGRLPDVGDRPQARRRSGRSQTGRAPEPYRPTQAVGRLRRPHPVHLPDADRARSAALGAAGVDRRRDPSIESCGPTNITPWWRIEVPTRPSVTCSFHASAVWTEWLTAAKLDLHGNTPSWPPTAATAAVIWFRRVTACDAIVSWRPRRVDPPVDERDRDRDEHDRGQLRSPRAADARPLRERRPRPSCASRTTPTPASTQVIAGGRQVEPLEPRIAVERHPDDDHPPARRRTGQRSISQSRGLSNQANATRRPARASEHRQRSGCRRRDRAPRRAGSEPSPPLYSSAWIAARNGCPSRSTAARTRRTGSRSAGEDQRPHPRAAAASTTARPRTR